MSDAGVQQRVMFENVFEAVLVRGYGQRMTPALKRQLKLDGVDLDKPLAPAYPVEVWMRVVHAVGVHLEGGADLEAQKKVGARFMAGYFETLLGRSVLPLLKLLGPLRSLRRMTQNFRGGNNFVETKVTEASPTDVTLWMNHCLAGNPGFVMGLLQHGLERIGAPSPRVEAVAHAPSGEATVRIRWG